MSAVRPRNFVDDWTAVATPRPTTTVANAMRDIRTEGVALSPRPLGPRFARLTAERIAGIPYVEWGYRGGLDVSPNGEEVAFAWNRTGHYEIFVAPVVGEHIYQLTESEDRSCWPRWSPDGRTLAFVRDHGFDERFDLLVIDRDGRVERTLAADPFVSRTEIAWSPDGTRIACATKEGERKRIEVIDLATGGVTRLTSGEHGDGRPQWSPDGSWILFEAGGADSVDLYAVRSAGGDPVRLETRDGATGQSADVRFAPDGACISFTTNVRGRFEIAVAPFEDGTIGRVDILTRTVYDGIDPRWRPDGRGVAYKLIRDGDESVRQLLLASRVDSPLADEPGAHRSIRYAPGSEGLAYIFSNARQPWDVWFRGPRTIGPRQLSMSASDVDPAVFVESVHVRYPAADGRQIPALLYVPHQEAVRAGGPPPVVVYLHGGPHDMHHRGWDPVAQWFANLGYVVFAPNVRGSFGYGREFLEAAHQDHGRVDVADVVAGLNWLEQRELADGGRAVLYGMSYGGFLTLGALAAEPDRWRAACTVGGVATYSGESMIPRLGSVAAPLLVLRGGNDRYRGQAEHDGVTGALRSAGRTVEEHVYANEGHMFGRVETRADGLRRAADWFERHGGR